MSWHDALEDHDLHDPLNNLENACTEMLRAIEDGRYQFEPVHVEADLRYLRAEVRRARRLFTRKEDA